MSKKPVDYLKLERKIAASEKGGVVERWRYGRALLVAKAGRKQLPHGMIADLIKAAANEGIKISDREIRRRVQCATAYPSEAKVGRALADFGSWSALAEAGFPEVLFDVEEFERSEGHEAPSHDSWEQMSLLPGFKPTLKIGGKEKHASELTVPEVLAYRLKFRETHESYGKTLEAIEATCDAILDGWDGNPETKAVDAYRLGAGGEPPP